LTDARLSIAIGAAGQLSILRLGRVERAELELLRRGQSTSGHSDWDL